MATQQEYTMNEVQKKNLATMNMEVLRLIMKKLGDDLPLKAELVRGELEGIEILGYAWPAADLGLSRHTLDLICEKIASKLALEIRERSPRYFVPLPLPESIEMGIVTRDAVSGFSIRAIKYFDVQNGTLPVKFEIGVKV